MAHLVTKPCGRKVFLGATSQERVSPKCLPRQTTSPYVRLVQSMAPGTSKGFLARSRVISRGTIEKINGEQLEVAIASRETTLIVDFFATWCGPCLLLARELEKVAETMKDQVKIVKIDVDENPELSNMLKIQGLPTIVIIPKENGKPALRTEGLLPAEQIMEIVGQLESGQIQQQPQQQPQ